MRVTKKAKEQILHDSNHQCEYCGVKLDINNVSIDHKIPLSKGGTNDISNLAAACIKCNIINADKIIDSISNPIVKQVAETWIHSFIKSPRMTSLISTIITFILTITVYYITIIKAEKRQQELSKNLNFATQIEQLDMTEKNLKQLLNFISTQKNNMIITEQSINSLKKEQKSLKPLVAADKRTVEALFKAQEIRAEENANKEHWIGFAFGVGGSLLASIIWYIFQYFIRIAREKT